MREPFMPGSRRLVSFALMACTTAPSRAHEAAILQDRARAEWTTLWAELRSDHIRIGIGDLDSAESKSVTKDLDGCIGLFVSGDSPWKAPVQYRNLRVDPL